jgi:hypothetical protein
MREGPHLDLGGATQPPPGRLQAAVEQKIRLEKKHELHSFVPPCSSSSLHRSELEATASTFRFTVPNKSKPLYPSHARSVTVEVLGSFIHR